MYVLLYLDLIIMIFFIGMLVYFFSVVIKWFIMVIEVVEVWKVCIEKVCYKE